MKTDSTSLLQDPAARLLSMIVELTHAPVSGPERQAAMQTIGDTLGVMLAGACDPRARDLLATLVTTTTHGPDTHPPATTGLARLPGGRIWAAPTDVALLLGFAAHVLDYDDDETEVAMAHLSAPCLPAALALSGGAASGADLIDAYVSGCQVMLAVGSAVNPALYKAGWHATSVLGAFGATAAAARLARLNVWVTAQAFGLAASFAGGPRGAFGGEGKPMQVAQAAASGVRAVQLAARGWTAAPGAIAGDRGVLTRMAGAISPALSLPEAFPPAGFVTKPYPSCTATHAAVAEIIALMARSGGRQAADLQSIACAVDPFVPQILIPGLPGSPDAGRFSLGYCLAHAALHGDLTPQAFAPQAFCADAPSHGAVRALMGRIVIGADETLPKGPSGISTGAVLCLRWPDGFTLSGRRAAGPGSRTAPLSDTELLRKFTACLAPMCSAQQAQSVWHAVAMLASSPSAGAFIDALPPVFTDQGQDR
ncbi:MAG TPA: MmgE/PrpD family protein [Paenirhodobacter sp.]